MNKALVSLDVINVASPCQVPWDGMTGDDRVRHCGECRLNVYNLSDMTRADAEALVTAKEGRLCVRFFRRTDGTILTQDCPVGLRAMRRRIAKLAAGIAAMTSFLVAGIAAARSIRDSQDQGGQQLGPLMQIAEWIDPPVPGGWIAGMICPPSIQPIATPPEPSKAD